MSKEKQCESSGRRIDREIKTIKAMIGIYCKRKHQTNNLCEDCSDLLDYAVDRLKKCPYGENKPPCKECPIHCYKEDCRTRVREVMFFAGPFMPLYHPVMAVKHALKGFGKKEK
ncbi:MAG: nitrous oxide-stimulated promoter family protein [Deltaproteobacteria bacterium]|nr:nitrous oxide-stimulated promoter family protein [Deltaproteobacteria bacterium]